VPAPYHRLNPLDRSFLVFESHAAHMFVAGTATFESGPLRKADGGLDIARIRSFVEARLERLPRYRQIVSYTPLGSPIWIDDPHFNLEYHVRHTSLPRPGGEEQLKALSGRIYSQALDRARPLWELWIVEGLGGGERFGFISKVHHAMVDGISAVDLLEALLTTDGAASSTDLPPAQRWLPRKVPARQNLMLEDLGRVFAVPLALARAAPALLKKVREPGSEVRAALRGLTDLATKTLHRPSATPLNKPIGPHRRFDWTATDLAEVKAVRKAFGGSINDVVLATVAGAVRLFLEGRGVNPQDIDFRVMTPVSIRDGDQKGTLGNQVSAWMVPLPIGERDPKRRLLAIQAVTGKLKEERNALGAELLTRAAGFAPSTLLSLAARLSFRNLPFNMVVTNVPGPQLPLYLLGARLLDNYGLVPLTDYLGLGLVIFSYDGKLCWGLNADWDLVPDVAQFARALELSFAELRAAARPAELV
jgi:diacylglycerol O-acyltransferase / wax synthase